MNMATKADIIIIGGGAAGLMAAAGAAKTLGGGKVIVLEKMARPGRKIMITGKGRCNFTNLKQWNEFQQHVHPKPNFLKPSFYNLSSEKMLSFLEENGFAFDFEVLLLAGKLGARIAEMPVKIINHRESKVNVIKDAVRMLKQIAIIKKHVKSTDF